MRPIKATVNLEAITHNYRAFKALHPKKEVLAVIKADAYGHGAIPCANALSFADGLAVCCIEEATELRDANIEQDIVLLEGFFDADELPIIEQLRLQIVIHNFDQIEKMSVYKKECALNDRGLSLNRVYVKFNCGMNRLGFDMAELDMALFRLNEILNPAVKPPEIVLLSHFPRADEVPVESYLINRLENLGEKYGIPSCFSNTAGALASEIKQDIIRCGIGLYGVNPVSFDNPIDFIGCQDGFELKTAMSLKSRIISIKNISSGEYVGYGRNFCAPHNMRIAIVAGGYADGIPRVLSGASVLVNGKLAPIIGVCSMDMMTIDISHIFCRLGDEVEIFGKNHPVEHIANAAGTNPYEILSSIKRVKKVYTN